MSTVATDYSVAQLQINMEADIRTDLDSLTTINLDELIEKHGAENITNALSNLITEQAGETIKNRIADRDDIPQSVKDQTYADIDAGVAAQHKPTTSSAQADIDAIFAQAVQNGIEDMTDENKNTKPNSAEGSGAAEGTGDAAESEGVAASEGAEAAEAANDEVTDAVGESGTVSGSIDAGDSWLVALARIFGKIAGQHLAKAIEYSGELAELAAATTNEGMTDQEKTEFNASKAAKTTEVQALFQAEMQQFKMTMEPLNNSLKTVGETYTAMARKQ
ncbi:MAG: hypothetical protein V3U76_09575 [Granulosicoccus sp.]